MHRCVHQRFRRPRMSKGGGNISGTTYSCNELIYYDWVKHVWFHKDTERGHLALAPE
jgi:hypothetical protein